MLFPRLHPPLPALGLIFTLFFSAAGCAQKLPPKMIPVLKIETETNQQSQIVPISLKGKKLLVVHSYHPEYAWVAAISKGIDQSVAPSGLESKTFYMDTKRNNTEAWKIAKGVEARQFVQRWRPDAVITCDDNAQSYFARDLVGTALPIVFCGVNEDPSKYGFPAKNVTGVIERPHFQRTLDLLAELAPIRRIALLSNDDATSRAMFSYAKEQSADLKGIQLVECVLTNDYQKWQATVARFGRTVDAFGVYTYHTLHSGDASRSMDPAVVIAWTAGHAAKPTVGFFDFAVESGLLAGVVESGEEQGLLAGGYAKSILMGTSPEHLPIIRGTHGLKMFNRKAGKRLGIVPPSDPDLKIVQEP